MSAVCLIVVLALAALQAGVNLSSNTNSLSLLGERHLGPNPEDLADDLVSYGERIRTGAPVTADGVPITGADTTALNLDIDIIVAQRSWLPRVLLEVQPVISTGRLEAGELFRISHVESCPFERSCCCCCCC